MLRKFWALLASLSLALVVLPLAAAQAAPVGTVALTDGAVVFPTASRNFAFTVTNGGSLLGGESINWVRFVLPTDEAGVVHNTAPITAPAGWTQSREGTEPGETLQTVTFRTTSGTSTIRPGASLSFAFPAAVERPLNSDRTGLFTVASSSDSGRTTKGLLPGAGQTLASTVKILEVVGGVETGPRAVDVASTDKVADGSATAGQTIRYTYRVLNHATQGVTVTGALSSDFAPSDSNLKADAITPGETKAILGNSTAPSGTSTDSGADFVHTIVLGDAGKTADRVSLFTSSASVAGASPAAPLARSYTVQIPALLALSDLRPVRVRSVDDTAVTFSALAGKTGSPTLDVASGELKINGTSITTLPRNDFAAGTQARRVEFAPVSLKATTLSQLTEALVNATANVVSRDGNGFDAVGGRDVLSQAITIDNVKPALTVSALLPLDRDRDSGSTERQLAAKNGDAIAVSGAITAADVDPAVGSGTAAMPKGKLLVTIVPNVGKEIEVPVTTQKTDTGFTFSGTSNPTFDKGATSFQVNASVSDTAGNPGDAVPTKPLTIDNNVPTLKNPGATTTRKSILVSFVDDDLKYLRGGCDPRHYRINGVPGLVQHVEFQGSQPTMGTGTPCALRSVAPLNSGTRVLILRNELAEDATPTVTYEPVARDVGGDPVRDGAVNDALRAVIDTVRQIAPLAPEIVRVTRNNGTEQATSVMQDDKSSSYYTRFPGTPDGDSKNEDLQISFLGSRNGYKIQVLDISNAATPTVLVTEAVVGPATPLDSGEATVRVPIGAKDPENKDLTFKRALRFVTTNASAQEIPGALQPFQVVLDTKAPALQKPSATGTKVAVTFDEVIQGGTDFASDWFGYITTASGTRSYQAEAVTVDNVQARTLEVPLPAGSTFGGVQYRFASGTDGGSRYIDRAGNALGNATVAK